MHGCGFCIRIPIWITGLGFRVCIPRLIYMYRYKCIHTHIYIYIHTHIETWIFLKGCYVGSLRVPVWVKGFGFRACICM